MKILFSQSFAPLRRFCLVLAAIFIVGAGFGAFAQEEQNRQLDAVKAGLDRIEQQLSGGALDDPDLAALQAEIDAARTAIAKVTESLAPRAQSIQTRLDQLGKPPADGQPAESPELTQERQAQLAAKAPIDEVLKRASALGVQADQLQENTAQKRRELFASRVLSRTRSLIDPSLWGAVIGEAPRRFVSVQGLAGEFAERFAERTSDRRGVLLLGALALALVIVGPLRLWVQRLGRMYFAESVPATRLRRSAGAIWVVLITTAAPIAAAFILYMGLVWQGFVPERAVPFVGSLVRLTGFVALVAGLTRAILSPASPSWRLPDIADDAAVRLAPYPLAIAGVAAIAHGLLAFFNIIGIGLAPVMATDGIAAAAIATAFALAMRPVRAAAESDDDAPSPPSGNDWAFALARIAAWLAVATILVAVLVGYISFAFFLANQMIWIGILGAVLYLLLILADDAITGWWPASRLGRVAHGTIGLKRSSVEQLAVLASGLLRLVLIAVAVLLAIAPWGVQSGDVVGWIRRAFTGISLGGFSFSPTAVLIALALIVAGVLLTRGVQAWLDKTFLPRTRLDDGLKNSIRTATGYAGVLLAIGLGFSALGFGLDRIALVAGALSVGIGFGLQSVVSNFVSGLILLAERPIKVGDWVGIGTEEGNVRSISVRSTAIELFDHSTLVVPNSDLITKQVRNWTHRNPLGVVRLTIGTGHEADVAEIRTILHEAAGSIPMILGNPPPEVLITATTDVGVQWTLRCTVPTPRQAERVKSELYFAVLKDFQARKIRITASPA